MFGVISVYSLLRNKGPKIDIFPINYKNPIRIEFWGDQIESIREFDVNTQLTVDNINLYNDTEAAIQVGSKGLLTDKETRLIADIGENAYIECDEVVRFTADE